MLNECLSHTLFLHSNKSNNYPRLYFSLSLSAENAGFETIQPWG